MTGNRPGDSTEAVSVRADDLQYSKRLRSVAPDSAASAEESQTVLLKVRPVGDLKDEPTEDGPVGIREHPGLQSVAILAQAVWARNQPRQLG